MTTQDPLGPLAVINEHATRCHERWIQRRNNLRDDEDAASQPAEWRQSQCGECSFNVSLHGVSPLATEWGMCSHPRSPFGGHAMFTHDGCRHYEGVLSKGPAAYCEQLWMCPRNNLRDGEDTAGLPDEWYAEQCGECRYFVPLSRASPLASDWGVCSHPDSPFDGRAMFEHDGCRHYAGASSWISDHPDLRGDVTDAP